MTRLQEATTDRLALTYGRLAVKEGFADKAVRITAPNGGHWHITPDGVPHQKAGDFSVDWGE